jgi:hypothetical protein
MRISKRFSTSADASRHHQRPLFVVCIESKDMLTRMCSRHRYPRSTSHDLRPTTARYSEYPQALFRDAFATRLAGCLSELQERSLKICVEGQTPPAPNNDPNQRRPVVKIQCKHLMSFCVIGKCMRLDDDRKRATVIPISCCTGATDGSPAKASFRPIEPVRQAEL